MFNAYMQVDFKNFIIFNLFYLLFCFGPQVCVGNSSFRICGFMSWLGSVRNIVLLHTHVSYFSVLHCQLFSSHHSLFICGTVTNQERSTFVEWCSSVPTCVIFSSVFFTMGNQESVRDISLLRQGKSN